MLKIGIIGIGSIANDYISFIKNGLIKAQLTAICSRNSKNMDDVICKYNLENIHKFESYEHLLQSKTVDAVIICTPHNTHIQIAKECLKNGIHTLIEKPIAIDLEEAIEFLEFKKAYPKVVCGVSYCNRLANGFNTVKKMVLDDAVGKIKRCSFLVTNYYRTQAYHDSASWRGTFEAEGGGVLMTQASHPLDILLWICSKPKRLSAFCYEGVNRGIEVENDAHIHMEFENGATAQFTTSSHELPGTNRLEIIGEKGQIILENGFDLTYNRLYTSEPEYAKTTQGWFNEALIESKKIHIEYEEVSSYQAKIINDFLYCVEIGGNPICSVEEAVDSLIIIKAAYKSSKLRKMIEID